MEQFILNPIQNIRFRDDTGGIRPEILLFLALGAALVSRLAALIVTGDFNLQTARIWEYGEQGLCAYRTGGDLCMAYHGLVPYPSALMPPSASYIWLGIFHLFGATPTALAVFGAISLMAGLASVWLVFDLALGMTRSVRAAFFAAALIAVYPTFVYVTAIYHTTNLTVAVNLALVRLCWKIAKGDVRVRTLIAAGLTSALCARPAPRC